MDLGLLIGLFTFCFGFLLLNRELLININRNIASNLLLGPKSAPYNLYFNLYKVFFALLLLLSKKEINQKITDFSLKKIIAHWIPLCLILMGIGLATNFIAFEFKLNWVFLPWLIINLMVCCQEEIIYRLHFQDFLCKKMPKTISKENASRLCLLLSSLAFAFMHAKGTIPTKSDITYCAYVLIAGLFYGHIYQRTRSIVCSTLLHFFFNVTHFIFFTYPKLG
jgi:uncharacterized protein